MTDLLGQLLGNYQLEALLATGPTGPTYTARHAQLRRLCSMKVFDPALTADPAIRAQLLDSLRRVAALRHPNLLTVFDLGEARGRIFVASEAPAGGSVHALLQRLRRARTRLTISGALALARQSAEGLAHAHRRGIVHGALRPEVLRLSAAGEGATLKVGDIGIAPVLPVEATAAPAYLTPEQARGAAPDARTDVYSLGTLLYALLIGVPPFNLSALDQAAEKHLRARPVPPRVVRPEIPAALETIVLRCLARAPDERFANAGDLAEALRQVESALATPTPPSPAPPSAEPLLSSLLETPLAPPPPLPAAPTVSVIPDRQRFELTPGRSTVVSAQIHYRGSDSDRFSLSLEGVPEAWIHATDPPVELGPNARARLSLLINVPRDHHSAAGDYPAVLRARSTITPERDAAARIVCFVPPFVAPSITITPARASGRAEGEYSVTLRNDGNAEAMFVLSAEDPRLLLAYEFGQEHVRLAPGQSARIPLTVLAPRRLFGSPEATPFSVFAEAEDVAPVEARAEFVRRALMPLWAPLAAAGVVALAVLLGLLLNNARSASLPPPPTPTVALSPQPGAPMVVYFTVNPPVVAPGEPVSIAWDVRGAERVLIEQFGDVPPLGERSFRPEATTDFRLIARASDNETIAVQRVLVAPATPTLEPTAIPTAEPSPTPAPLPTAAPTAPPPVPTATLVPVPGSIALIDLAPTARWATNIGTIAFGAPRVNREQGGRADRVEAIQLEDGSLAPVALLTFPPLAPEATGENQSFIEGRFDLPQIQEGQFFLAAVGFAREARGTGMDVLVTFNNEVLYEERILPDGALTAISVDMAPFVGREGDLALRVSAERGAAEALYWVEPRIDRP